MEPEGLGEARRGDRRGEALVRAPTPRPWLWPAIALMGGIWLSEELGPAELSVRWVALLIPVAAFVALLITSRRLSRFTLAAVVSIAALAVGFARHQQATTPAANSVVHALSNEPVVTRVAGRIVTPPVERPAVKYNPFVPADPQPRTQFVLALDELRTTDPPQPIAGSVRVSVEAVDLGLRLGQRVELAGKLYRPSSPRNPGERDWRTWYRQQGIDAGLSVESPALVVPLAGEASWYARCVTAARTKARSLLFEPYADVDDEAGARLLDVMVLGQRSAADRELNEAFLRAGGMHFLAVSGFHVGVLAGATWWLLRRVLRRSRRTAALGMLLVTVAYAVVAEPNAPILRAATMVVLVALAIMTERPVCLINWLALAAACVLIADPRELFRAGFQLSFVQVVALVTVVPAVWYVLTRRRDGEPPKEAATYTQLAVRWLLRTVLGLAVVCACAYVVAVPLTLLHFGRLAPWGWLGTFILSPLVVLTIVASFATVLGNAFVPPIGAALGAILHGLTHALLWTVGLFASWPNAVIECLPPPVWLVAVTYAVLLWVVSDRGEPEVEPIVVPRPRTIRTARIAQAVTATLLVFTWVGWAVLPAAGPQDAYGVHVLAVGDGSTTLLTAPGGKAAVFDVGSLTNSDVGECAARALRALGRRRVELAVVSHANFDHYSGLPTLVASLPVERWLTNRRFCDDLPCDEVLQALRERLPLSHRAPAALGAGDSLALGGATLEVLWPPADWDFSGEVNDRSVVVRLTAGGRRVLLTGDIGRAALGALLAAERAGQVDLRADVLVAPHHGAVINGVTAEFCAAVAPEVVVVSAKACRLKLAGLVAEVLGPAARVLTTGECGAVSVWVDADGGWRVTTGVSP